LKSQGFHLGQELAYFILQLCQLFFCISNLLLLSGQLLQAQRESGMLLNQSVKGLQLGLGLLQPGLIKFSRAQFLYPGGDSISLPLDLIHLPGQAGD